MTNFFEFQAEKDDFRNLLNENRKEKNFIDVLLKIGDHTFDAHRNVLSLNSPVLDKAISKQCSKTMICSISDEYVDPEIVGDLLNFFYTGYIKLTPENTHSICLAANYLKVSKLLEPSVQYLCQLVTVENVLTLFQFSSRCQLEHLHRRCSRIIFDNHQTVLQSDQILQFPFKDFKDVIVGLKETFPKQTLRTDTFDCIVRWTEKNLSERSKHLKILLESLPLKELPISFLEKTVSLHPLVEQSISCKQIVSSAVKHSKNFKSSKSYMIVIRKQTSDEIGKTADQPLIDCYDPTKKAWIKLPKLPSLRFDFASTVANQQNIIVCGGYVYPECRKPTKSVEMFDWIEQSWKEFPEMPFSLVKLSIAAHHNHLYVIGRKKVKDPFTALRYSFKKKQWKEIKSFSERTYQSFCHLISCNNYLYGVYSVRNWCFKIFRYDHERNEWSIMAELPGEKWNGKCSAVSHGEKICFFSEPKNFAVYNPETNFWTDLPGSSFFQSKGLVSMNGRLLTLARLSKGSDRANYYIFEFDFFNSKWIQFGKVPIKDDSHVALLSVGNFE